jgi:hypothetical protein
MGTAWCVWISLSPPTTLVKLLRRICTCVYLQQFRGLLEGDIHKIWYLGVPQRCVPYACKFWLSLTAVSETSREDLTWVLCARLRWFGRYLSTHIILRTKTVDKNDTYPPLRFRDKISQLFPWRHLLILFLKNALMYVYLWVCSSSHCCCHFPWTGNRDLCP